MALDPSLLIKIGLLEVKSFLLLQLGLFYPNDDFPPFFIKSNLLYFRKLLLLWNAVKVQKNRSDSQCYLIIEPKTLEKIAIMTFTVDNMGLGINPKFPKFLSMFRNHLERNNLPTTIDTDKLLLGMDIKYLTRDSVLELQVHNVRYIEKLATKYVSSKEEVDDGEVEVVLDKNMVFPWKTRSVAELAGGEPWRWQAPGLKPPLEPATVPPLSP